MPKIVKRLKQTDIVSAKPESTVYRLCDGDGLRLQINPSGTKVWQYHYSFQESVEPTKENKWKKTKILWNIYTIGKLGDISLAEARAKRDELKKLVDEGIAPNEHKKQTRIKRQYENRNSFEAIAREWHTKQNWAEKHKANVLSRLELDAFPIIGKQAINKISRQEVLHILQNIEQRGALDVAKRIGQYCAAIFDYALLKGLCESNPAMGLAKVVQTKGVKHRACLKEKELPDFLKKLEAYSGGKLVMLAMKLLMLTFVRPGELRGARWEEIDEKKAEWRIPASRMKMKRDHIVPLSKQALAVIAEIKQISGNYEILFPGRKNIKTPISDVTLIKCLKILGYGETATPHGMRATASTILNENSFPSDHIEMQLAHVERNKIRAAYNRALYLEERRTMMQWWGDYLQKAGMK